MAKNALVLNGANFEENKVTTITISRDEKPCTGIVLDESSIVATELGDITITATVTPADTTDDIVWTTSDSTVATVVGGVVSVVGLGVVTITATCGTQTASCIIDASEVTMSVSYGFFVRYSLVNYPNVYGYSTTKRGLLIHSLAGTKTLKNQSSDQTDRYPVPIPNNTAVVKLGYGSDMRQGTIYFGWLNSRASAYPEQYPNVAELISLDQSHSTAYNAATTWEYEVPEGANSFAISLVTNSTDFGDSDTPEGIAAAKQIVIKCSSVSE